MQLAMGDTFSELSNSELMLYNGGFEEADDYYERTMNIYKDVFMGGCAALGTAVGGPLGGLAAGIIGSVVWDKLFG